MVCSYKWDVYVIICLKESLATDKQAAQPSDNYLCYFPTNHPTDSHFKNVFYKVVQKPPLKIIFLKGLFEDGAFRGTWQADSIACGWTKTSSTSTPESAWSQA